MRKKLPVPFEQKFPNVDPLALRLLQRLLAFDPKFRPNAEEALADPYFKGLAKVEREPSCQPITKMEFEFERRRVTKEDIQELIFCEILEYHPELLKDYKNGTERTSFLYPSAVDQFRKQFAHLEENSGKSGPVIPLERKHVSLPRSTIVHSKTIAPKEQQSINSLKDKQNADEASINTSWETEAIPLHLSRTLQAQQRIRLAKPGKVVGLVVPYENGTITNDAFDPRTFLRSTVLPPQAVHPAISYYKSSTGNFAPDIAINIDTNPFLMTRVKKVETGDDRNTIDTNLLQAKSHYDGIGVTAAAATTRGKFGTVQYGITRMY